MCFKVVLLAAVLVSGGLGCVSSRFAQLDRPVVIRDVAIGLLDESCDYSPTSTTPEPSADMRLTMQVRNTGLLDATFAPSAISLRSDGRELPAITTDETTIIRPGFTRTFTLRFAGAAPTRCDAPMAVVLDRALDPFRPQTAKHVLRFRGRALEAHSSPTNL